MTRPVDARLRDGITAARAKRLVDARALLQQAVDADPDNPLAWFWLAAVAPNAEAAVAHLRRVLALDASHVAARETLAKLLFAQADRLREAAERLSLEAASLAPQASEPQTLTQPSRTDSEVSPSSQVAPSRTVMVIDDSPTIRKILSLTLEGAGYSVIAEAGGESALGRLAEVVPDVILLDIAMPGIDGYETCKRIRSDSRTAHLPILMLSGKDALFDKVKGHMAGATEYLTKPFEAMTVLAAVAGACSEAA